MYENGLIVCNGAIYNITKVLNDNKIVGKLLYVSDPIVDNLYGKIVKRQLKDIWSIKEELVDNNTISYAMNLAERIIATDISCIVGLGGGKVLDVCKYAAYISKISYLAIPTTAANDGLVSPIAVLKRQDGRPKSLGASMPTMVLIDTNVIANGPIQNIKAGIGDTISNYMALIDWDLAASRGKDVINGYAYMMSKNSLDVLMKTQFDCICPQFIETLVNSLVLSGIAMDFAGSSRPVSGSEHCFSHALDYYCDKPILHGIQVALGTITMLKILRRDYSELLAYLRRFEVDINPSRLGIDENTFVLCMQNASSMRKGRYTYLDEIDLSDENLRKIYKELVEEL